MGSGAVNVNQGTDCGGKGDLCPTKHSGDKLRESGVCVRGRVSIRSWPSSASFHGSFHGGLFPTAGAGVGAGEGVARGRGQPSWLTPKYVGGMTAIAGVAAIIGAAAMVMDGVPPHDAGVPSVDEPYDGHGGVPED